MGQGGEAANHSPPVVSDDIHYQALRGVDNRTHQIINRLGLGLERQQQQQHNQHRPRG